MNYRAKLQSIVSDELPTPEQLNGLGQLRDQRVEGDLNDDLNQAEIEEMTKDLRLAAVLVPLVEHADEPSILLTRRADHLEKHSGQVAFPGGKVEDSDATPIAAALRETEEEIGLDASHIEIAGVLDTYQTGTGFLILPVVGFVKPGFTLTPDKNEVADVFEVPAHIALSTQNWKTDSGEWKGRMWNFYSMDYQGYNIWGATAGMLMHMSRRIAE
ncbi:CoA pyrophosphatase [Alphaproteobacteria bacterium]|jgi:8-oxo-dGTP pyrophosphatase MutT (NUDIX family)|nr:CoA pyrophosphatase [Alphaproteobacteria bacterium]MDA8624720.1 CoA pyrophosphatase [Alphaproteobacteria bacterium]MDA8666722.1 CoA pyrophosphatase [Alphaproteobacteria bacterium]MDA8726322.1 CoA pyrophosphatase [Alphaproteobacteria bacterium]MDA9590602.1 CoA pyrophosphatase [Alphaproteobacteria bacterium]|tara:strand:- start:326 stop:970 length:645 start_codon:yes stop_codon:yes gene_type:complete